MAAPTGLLEKLGRLGLLGSLDTNQNHVQTNPVDSFNEEVKSKSRRLIKKHQLKIDQTEQKLFQVQSQDGSGLSVDEATQRLKLIDAEKQVLGELRGQVEEYKAFVNDLMQFAHTVDDLDTHTLTRLQSEFKAECNRFEAALPIYAKKTSILATIRRHRVTILTAETGSGKSTQVVQYLNQHDGAANIVCTQPRKVAASSLANRVSEELNSNVGDLVGYRTGSKCNSNQNTRIIYMTDHTLLNECLHDPKLKKYKYIIVDEAHERSIATDLLLAMIKKALLKRTDLRLIISSATIDPKIFETYFQGMAQRIHVHGRTFPVEAVYETVSIGKDYLQISVNKAKKIHKNEEKGDILVFLTTPAETERAQESLLSDATVADEVVCLVLHGRLQAEDQQLVFKPTPAGKRKIVFATNSAETSITIPNIRYVVDSGMVKEKQYDRAKNVSVLKISPVNKSSAEQRMGRAGRTQPGKCYRLFTEEEYTAMADEMLPEILRENLGLAMLKLYQFNIGDPFNYDFVEAPPEEALKYAKEELQGLGAIVGNRLTRYGEIMAALDIEPKLGKFVALCIDEDVGYDAMVIAAVCSIGGSVFFRAGSENEKQTSDRLKARFCHQNGDLYTMLAVYKEWSEINERQKNTWCVQNSINAKSLRFTRDLVNDMKGNAEKLLPVDIDPKFSRESDLRLLVPQLLSRCFRYSLAYFSGHSRGGYFRPEWGNDRFHLHPSSALSFLSATPKWILFTEVLTTTRSFLLNTIAVPDRIAESAISKNVSLSPVKFVKSWTVGKELAKVLGLGRWNCFLEQTMQADISQHIYIDYDPNIGQVSLHCSRECEREAKRELDAKIDYERKWIDLKILDIPVSEGNATCVLLGKGGTCADVMFQGDFNGLLIRGISDTMARETVEWFFKSFGEIIEIIKFRPCYWWGKVTFKEPKDALKTIRTYRPHIEHGDDLLDFEKLYLKPAFNQQASRQNNNQSCCIKASWTRRPAKGNFAFITFNDQAVYNTFVGSSQFVGGKTYVFKRSKEELSLKVTGIDQYVSNAELQLSFENQFPDIKESIGKCVIPRVSPPPIESKELLDAKKRQLVNQVQQCFDEGARDRDRKRFNVEIRPISTGKEVNYEATVLFNNARDGQTVMSQNVTMGFAKVRFVPELKSQPFHVPTTLYHYIKEDLNSAFKEMPGITLLTNRNEKKGAKSNNVELSLEAKHMEHLTTATNELRRLVKGEHVQFSERQFRYFFTPAGHEFIEALKKHSTCIINVERRLRSVVIFGNVKSREETKEVVEQRKALVANINDETWIMKLNEQPNGFIKCLIKKYKVNFEVLYKDTGATYISINIVRGVIEFNGSTETLSKCKQAMDDLVMEMDSNVKRCGGDRGDCPICFDALETTSHQLEICSHSYCKECFQMMCENAIKSKELPMRCAHEECDHLVSINDMIEHLEPKDIVPVAVEQLVATKKDDFKYCITPDCLNIYKISKRRDPDPFYCLVCQEQVCTFCHEKYHAGLPCRFQQRGADDGLSEWLAANTGNHGLCPSCSAPIDKFEGCLHVTCALCKKHVCWRCKRAVFDSSNDCYNHLALCGGIFA